MLALILNHFSFRLFALVGSRGAVEIESVPSKCRMSIKVGAIDANALLGPALAASLADFISRAVVSFQSTFVNVPVMREGAEVQDHANRLLEKLAKVATLGNAIISRAQVVLRGLVESTEFEQLMDTVLEDDKSAGLSAVHAEPGSIATVLAVRKQASKSAVVVLLQRGFQKNLKYFFRLSDAEYAVDVAWALFLA